MRSSSLISCVGMLLAFTALSSADIFSLPIAGTVKVGRTVSLSGLYTAESGDVAAAENFWLSWANNQVRLTHHGDYWFSHFSRLVALCTTDHAISSSL